MKFGKFNVSSVFKIFTANCNTYSRMVTQIKEFCNFPSHSNIDPEYYKNILELDLNHKLENKTKNG